jgi:hypothetical protein
MAFSNKFLSALARSVAPRGAFPLKRAGWPEWPILQQFADD